MKRKHKPSPTVGEEKGQGRCPLEVHLVRHRPVHLTCVITFAGRACQWEIMKCYFVKYGAFQSGLAFFPVSSEEWDFIDSGGD